MGHRICAWLRGWVGGQEGVDLGVLGFSEAEGDGWDDAFDLFGVASAYDGGSDGWVAKGPGYGYHSGAYVVTVADLLEMIGYGKVAGEVRLLVVFGSFTEVVFREVGDSFFGHGPGEQAGVHGGVVDGADVVGFGVGKDLGFYGTVEHGVGRLVRGDGGNLHRALHLGD